MSWMKTFGLFIVFVQFVFGALEMFLPRCVYKLVLANYPPQEDSPVWLEADKITRNMGLYNWFLAVGLALSLFDFFKDTPAAQFFAACIATAGFFGLITVDYRLEYGKAFWGQLILGLAGMIFLR